MASIRQLTLLQIVEICKAAIKIVSEGISLRYLAHPLAQLLRPDQRRNIHIALLARRVAFLSFGIRCGGC